MDIHDSDKNLGEIESEDGKTDVQNIQNMHIGKCIDTCTRLDLGTIFDKVINEFYTQNPLFKCIPSSQITQDVRNITYSTPSLVKNNTCMHSFKNGVLETIPSIVTQLTKIYSDLFRENYIKIFPVDRSYTSCLDDSTNKLLGTSQHNIDNLSAVISEPAIDHSAVVHGTVYSINENDQTSKSRQIIFLNFDDDSIVTPVFHLGKKQMDIIEKWYDDCDILFDIEETGVFISDNVDILKCRKDMLFRDINPKYKEEYLNNYVPEIIKDIERVSKLNNLERLIFNKESIFFPQFNNEPTIKQQSIKENKEFLDLGVIVPPKTKLIFENIPLPLTEAKDPIGVSGIFDFEKKTYDRAGNIDPQTIVRDERLKQFMRKFNKTDLMPLPSGIDRETIMMEKVKLLQKKDPPVDDVGPMPYNSEYNTLYPRFGDNCEVLCKETEYPGNNMNNMNNMSHLYRTSSVPSIFVVIHAKSLHTFVIKNPSVDELNIIRNHKEFGFMVLFKYVTNNEDIINFIEQQFDHRQYKCSDKIEELNKKIQVLDNFIGLFNNTVDNYEHCPLKNGRNRLEEESVKEYFNDNYTIDNDIAHRMKASALYEIFTEAKFVKINQGNGFRTRLSVYLKNLGLQKKRFNDGYYYYGIVEKVKKETFKTSLNEYPYMNYRI